MDWILGFLFVVLFENAPVIIGLVIAFIILRKVVAWIKKNPEKHNYSILD